MGRIYYFHAQSAEQIIGADRDNRSDIEISLDLNRSREICSIRDHSLVLDDCSLPVQQLEAIASAGNKVYCYDGKDLVPIEVRTDGYYKLVPTESVPTLEINGVKMHRSKDIDPLEDARLKTELVVRLGNNVLDTCGGLGYSALFALKAGAKEVVSLEKSRAVLEIRKLNPWLQPGAFEWLTPEVFLRLRLEHGDSTQKIKSLPNGYFEAVVHDPPRFCSATGDLYGIGFYTELARVMKTGGRLFHYTGSPKKIVHQDKFIQNAIKRLDRAGFNKITFNDRLQGIYGEKARHPIF